MDLPISSISTDDPTSYAGFFGRIHVPSGNSHKGQNGKVMVIGGSSLFHSALVWPAEAASHFADMVHVSSTEENNEIIREMKIKWRNGIVVSQNEIPEYVAEDDAVLIGNGMMRTPGQFSVRESMSLHELFQLQDEGERTYYLTEFLLKKFPGKKWVLDAGALQMMKPEWLTGLSIPGIVTPHQKEFEKLFGVLVSEMEEQKKIQTVAEMAAHFHCIILLKSVFDIVSDGTRSYVIRGGNVGLTRGGTGDILAGITTALYTKNSALDSAVAGSLLLKLTAEELGKTHGIWYNNTDLLNRLPLVMHRLMEQYNQAYRQTTLVDTKGLIK